MGRLDTAAFNFRSYFNLIYTERLMRERERVEERERKRTRGERRGRKEEIKK